MHLAGRMFGRDVERGEIVEIVLDVGAFGDRKAHLAEDRDAFVGGLADRVQMAGRARAHRQGDVERLGGEPRLQCGIIEFRLARLERRGDRVLDLIQRLTGGAARLRFECAQTLHALGDRALAAKRGDAHRLQRAKIGGAVDAGDQVGLQGVGVGCRHRRISIAGARRAT